MNIDSKCLIGSALDTEAEHARNTSRSNSRLVAVEIVTSILHNTTSNKQHVVSETPSRDSLFSVLCVAYQIAIISLTLVALSPQSSSIRDARNFHPKKQSQYMLDSHADCGMLSPVIDIINIGFY